MTIRLNMDLWPQGNRAATKRIGALTIEPQGGNAYLITVQDHTGLRQEVTITDWPWEASHPWRLINEALTRLEDI